MYYVYILESTKRLEELYIGSTNNLKRRFTEHNAGKIFSTNRYKPWRLIYYGAFTEESSARNREHNLKYNGNAMRELKKRIYTNKNPDGFTPHHFLSAKSGAGFTLIELLVVISIIALLASVTLIALNDSRIKARNTKRKEDAAQIRKALDLYYHDNGSVYPNGGAVGTPNNETDIQNLSSFLVPKYLSQLPNDPKNSPKNYQYVWGQSAGSPQDYGLLIPFGNDNGQNCKWITPNGNDNWFKVGPTKVPNCNY